MPAVPGEIDRLAELIKPAELIIDQGFKGAEIERFESRPPAAGKARDEWQECRLGLTRCGGSGDDDIGYTFQQHGNSALLDVVEFVPALLPDPTANRFAQPLETG